jgi:uncharacterized protein (TIGR03437 family)
MKTFILFFTSASAWAGASLPLWFEPNLGQAHASVQFLSRSVYLGSGKAAIHAGGEKPLVMSLAGARKGVVPEGLEPLPGITSYFIGNDPKKWRSGVPHFAKVRYKDIYPGIDLIYYGNAEGKLEYDFVVASGADPGRLEIAYNHPVREDGSGDLLIAGVRQRLPRVYQGDREISARYLVRGRNRVQVALSGYDHSQQLTVDPVIVYSTYLGGPAFEVGTGIQVDSKGYMYVSLYERAPSSPTLNPFQQTSSGSYAAFVAKFTPDGQSNVYYAYAGGTSDTYTQALAVDAVGNAYVTGSTTAFDFPVKNAVQQQYGGGFNDTYALKFSPDGRTILYSTYLGGNNEDEAEAIAINSSGEAYIAGFTYSSDYPVIKAFQPRKGNGADGFLTHLSADGKSFVSSTFLGGDYGDYVKGVAIDAGGFIYLIGGTTSDDFPLKNPFQATLPTFAGIGATAFVTKLTPAGDALVYSTLLGGPGGSGGWAIAVDSSGSPSICGTAFGSGFPTKNAFQPAYGGGQSDIFVARLTPDGSALVFSTYFGGSDFDFQNSNSLALDSGGNIYVTGWTGSSDFPMKQSLQSFIGATTGYKFDAFISKFTPTGSLVYSTLVGGHGDDRGVAITVDSGGAVYVAGSTSSEDFPLKNPFQRTNGGAGDVMVLKLAPDVAPPSPFSPTPGTAQFTFVLGGSAPASQTISIPSGGPFSTTTSSAPWASVTPQTGNTPGTLTVSVNPAGLAPKVYSGTIQIVPPSGTPFTLPVTLNVLAPAPVVKGISPSTVPLNSGATTFRVTGVGFTSASIVKFQSSTELATTFIDSGNLQFSLPKDFFTLSGAYSINVAAPQTAPSSPVTFTVGAPALAVRAITNAGSYANGAVAPGEIISLFGTNMGPATGAGLSLTPAGLVSTNVGGVQVLFDGTPAPLIYARSDQVSAIVPYGVAGHVTAQVTVVFNGQPSTPLTVPVTDSAPALFTADASGKGQGAILNQNGSVNSSTNPAGKGSVVVLYGTGEGATNPPGVDGQIAGSVLPKPILPVSVTIDGRDAVVLYAGAAPSEVAGVIQVNVLLPDGINSGPVPVVLKVGSATSQAGVLLAVQ